MLATLGGLLALPFGLAVLLLPLLATELSRPRDSLWGAVVLLQGLVLVTCADRLTGAPMLAVLGGGLLLGRLGMEVGQARWRQLTPEEQERLGSLERWSTSFRQLGATLAGLGGGMAAALGQVRLGRGTSTPTPAPARGRTKRWVRPEAAAAAPEPASSESAAPEPAAQEPAAPEAPGEIPAPGTPAEGPSAEGPPGVDPAAAPAGPLPSAESPAAQEGPAGTG